MHHSVGRYITLHHFSIPQPAISSPPSSPTYPILPSCSITTSPLASTRRRCLRMESKGDLALFERLAVARLQYTVNELQTKVDYDRRLSPPVRKTIHCITDDSALVQSIGDLKHWIGDSAISMTVPLCTLDALDDLKKGTDIANVNSRESIRYFDRCQSGAGRKPVRGVRVQAPSEMFSKWEECARFQDPDVIVPAPTYSTSPGYHRRNRAGGSGTNVAVTAPPKWVQPILNCALHKLHPPGKESRVQGESEEIVLVTNNETVATWAKVYGIKAVDSQELADMVERENWEYMEKKRVYESGSGRGGRNGSISGRGGRGRGGHRRDSSREENGAPMMGFSPPSPRGNHIDPGFILRGAPRGVARGRGKLWEP